MFSLLNRLSLNVQFYHISHVLSHFFASGESPIYYFIRIELIYFSLYFCSKKNTFDMPNKMSVALILLVT